MRHNDEWEVMRAIFDEYGMRNYFYEKTPEGVMRSNNRAVLFQLQDLWYEEGLRLWNRLSGAHSSSREGHDLERAEGRVTHVKKTGWKMDIFSLLQVLNDLMNSHHDQELNEEVPILHSNELGLFRAP